MIISTEIIYFHWLKNKDTQEHHLICN
jgi:hypothetical protein